MRTKGYKLWRCIWPNDIYATDGVSFWDPHAYSFSLWTTHQWKRFLRIPARLRRIFGSTVGDN
jgi:hypothetical protein